MLLQWEWVKEMEPDHQYGLLEVMRRKGFETTFRSPITKILTKFCGYAFVDDSDLLQSAGANSTLNDPDTTLISMQQAIDCWEAVAKSTGGAIATDKSWWYIIHFNWKMDNGHTEL